MADFSGKSNYSTDNADRIKQSYQNKPVNQVFHRQDAAEIDPLMSPYGLVFRESRDSTNYPNSHAITIGLDVTASMQTIPEYLVRHKLPTLIDVCRKHGISDPAVLFMAIGDHLKDKAPIQIGQFESDEINLNKWLTSVWLEAKGGGNNGESYLLGWYVTGKKTSIDCYEKRGEKGFYFSVGDEPCHELLSAEDQQKLFGPGEYSDVTATELLELARKTHHVFHLHCTEGDNGSDPAVIKGWKDRLGENLIIIDNKETIAEVIATTIAVFAGADIKTVVQDFDSTTALAVQHALANVTSGGAIAKKEGSGISAL